jgi:hypothetical protein
MQKEALPGGVNGTGKYELVFAVTHPGDREYRPAVQQAHMFIPATNNEGADQQIDFPPIADQKLGTKGLHLRASSNAHVPVSFYVREGPATVQGDLLTFTPVPERAHLPIAVTIVAWQYGRASGPKLRTADPVTRTFYLTR